MTEKTRNAGLAEQIELAKKNMEEWPDWLRSNAHFSGTDHALEDGEGSGGLDQPPGSGAKMIKFG